MTRDDTAVEQFFERKRSKSDLQIKMVNDQDGTGKKGAQESSIPGIYQEVKNSFEFMLHKITNKSGSSNVNVGSLDSKR